MPRYVKNAVGAVMPRHGNATEEEGNSERDGYLRIGDYLRRRAWPRCTYVWPRLGYGSLTKIGLVEQSHSTAATTDVRGCNLFTAFS